MGSLSKFAGGLLSDLTFLKLPRVWLITVTNLCQAAVVSVCIFAADIPAVTISLAVIHYMGKNVLFSFKTKLKQIHTSKHVMTTFQQNRGLFG